MLRRTFIFGHKMPDTDSVCASISLSYLKNQIGYKTEARVLGNINNETKYVLKYFNLPEPVYLNDVKVRVRNMHYNQNAFLNENSSIDQTFEKIVNLNLTGIPLVSKTNKLLAYVNLKDISKFIIDGNLIALNTSYNNILKTLKGKEVLKFDEEIKGTIVAATYRNSTFIENVNLTNDSILIIGDRKEIVSFALNKSVKMIILVGNISLFDELKELAIEKRVNVIKTPYYSYETSNKIRLANYINVVDVMKNPISLLESDFRKDFLETANKYGHTNYPVVSKNNECLGMARLIDNDNYDKRKVILVDHNQIEQSVDGLEEAQIVEIVDHHNLGSVATSAPISFRSMPVGCTCTIIYQLYKENNVVLPREIAGIMLGAILSDTLLLKSPTTTKVDIDVAYSLAKIANIDIEKFGLNMFEAGSSIEGMDASEIITQDFKTFKAGDNVIGIGQIMTLDFEKINSKKDVFIEQLNQIATLKNCKMVLFFVTDIIKNGSYIYYNVNSKNLVEDIYNIKELHQGYFMKGVVSRKKQMLPVILEFMMVQ